MAPPIASSPENDGDPLLEFPSEAQGRVTPPAAAPQSLKFASLVTELSTARESPQLQTPPREPVRPRFQPADVAKPAAPPREPASPPQMTVAPPTASATPPKRASAPPRLTPTKQSPTNQSALWGTRGIWQQIPAPQRSARGQVSAIATARAVFAHTQAPRVSMWLAVVAASAVLAVFLSTRDAPPAVPPDVETSTTSAAPTPVPPIVRGEQPSVNPPAAQQVPATQPIAPTASRPVPVAPNAVTSTRSDAAPAATPVEVPRRPVEAAPPRESVRASTTALGAEARSAKAAPTQATRAAAATAAPRPTPPAAPAPSPGFRGSLTVRSSPEGALVFVNGAQVGVTPLVLEDQAAGSRAVRVELDGYERWSTATRIVANQSTAVVAELRPLPAR
jgi:hypothetical protein